MDLTVGVYLLLAADRRTSSFPLSIASCACYSFLALLDAVSLFWRPTKHVLSQRVCLVGTGVVPLLLAGGVLALFFLGNDKSGIGRTFCDEGHSSCAWVGDRAILTAFMLWFGAALAQTLYTASYMSRTLPRAGSGGSMQNDTPMSSPMAPTTPVMVERSASIRRVPILRQDTSDEPFSYEAALQAKVTVAPPGHQNSQSQSSGQSNVTFVQTHMANPSHSRSWASTLPTAISGASPRSIYSNLKFSASDGIPSRRGSPDKQEWGGWGIALSSPRHKEKKENVSCSNTYSTTSSKRSRPTKSLTSFRFHLPNSPEPRDDSKSLSSQKRTHTTNDSGSSGGALFRVKTETRTRGLLAGSPMTAAAPITSTTTGRLDSSPGLRHKGPRRLESESLFRSSRRSVTESDGSRISGSPDRRRTSILESFRPRLPDAASFSNRHSWISKSNSSSPTKSVSKRDTWQFPVQHGSSPTEDAFAEWDTSNLECDPAYLVSLQDSREARDLSATPRRRARRSTAGKEGDNNAEEDDEQQQRKNGELVDDDDDHDDTSAFDDSPRSEASLWGGRSVRVASDGSIMAREDGVHGCVSISKLSSRVRTG